ncbi:MAG TPA: DNA/RNA non-specific endonuclease [Clostridia bacterium]
MGGSHEKNPPKQVKVKITPIYQGDSLRPDKFKLVYQIGNEDPVTVSFKNKPGGK